MIFEYIVRSVQNHINSFCLSKEMKYAHLADIHLGSWREPKMRDASTNVFLKAIDLCMEQQVDFILFSGDIFNTSLPSVDTLKIVTQKLKELHNKPIPVYVIAGSHDFSASGKTMIDVLEKAGLLINVCKGTVNPETQELQLKFTIDVKTGAKITGILGRKGQLDKIYYHNLQRENLEQESGYKIFMFHTTISEMKPNHLAETEGQPVSFLPKRFNYYAGGHIHHPTKIELPEYGTLTYPGALFPNTFAEIEKYSPGGYQLVSVEGEQQTVEWIPVKLLNHVSLNVDCSHKNPEKVTEEILEHFQNKDLTDAIITLRIHGQLQSGKISGIDFKTIFQRLQEQKAFFVMKNTAKVITEEFEEISLGERDPEKMEEEIIKEHLQQIKLFDAEREFTLTKTLLNALNTTRKEGETVSDFQKRVESEMDKILP